MPCFLTSDGCELFYTDAGQGRPVVLLHAWPLSSAMWDAQATLLTRQGYRVICHDRRGFGRSDQPWIGYDYDRFADDLAELLNHLDLQRATLVGFSMGSGEVARYLARHGDARIAQAVLMAGTTPFMMRTADNPEGVDSAVLHGLLAAIEQDRPAVLAQLCDAYFSRTEAMPPVAESARLWYLSMALQASARAVSESARAWFSTDFRADMGAFQVPTLVMHGAEDRSVPAHLGGRAAAQAIAGSRYIEYAGADHAIVASHRQPVEADLLAFLQSA